MRRKVPNFLIGFIFGALCFSIAFFLWNSTKMTKIHKLKTPLILASDSPTKNLHLLPAGTTLYFDKSFPEGFTRYRVYINIDRMPLSLTDLADPTEIDPIEARAFDKFELNRALHDYPLTRQDLERILNSNQLTREEIMEVLANYIEATK